MNRREKIKALRATAASTTFPEERDTALRLAKKLEAKERTEPTPPRQRESARVHVSVDPAGMDGVGAFYYSAFHEFGTGTTFGEQMADSVEWGMSDSMRSELLRTMIEEVAAAIRRGAARKA